VLGEMLELGEVSRAAHIEVGRHAAACAELVLAVGTTADDYLEGAQLGGLGSTALRRAVDIEGALEQLLAELRPGDVVLLKGSRGAALDLLVDRLRGAAAAGARA